MKTEDIIQQLELAYEDSDGVDDLEGFDVVEEGVWVQDFKYQISESVVRHKESGKYFKIFHSRSGSYYSDYEYNAPEFYEVNPVAQTKIVLKWELV